MVLQVEIQSAQFKQTAQKQIKICQYALGKDCENVLFLKKRCFQRKYQNGLLVQSGQI